MEASFDYTRLEGNLYTSLVGHFEKATRTRVDLDYETPKGLVNSRVTMTLEKLAITWLQADESHTIEELLTGPWAAYCQVPEDVMDYSEDFNKVMGFLSPTDPPEFAVLLDGICACAIALAQADFESSLLYSSIAERHLGFIEGVDFVRDGDADLNTAMRRLSFLGADVRHKEHRDMKAQVVEHYEANRHLFRSKDQAAEAMANKLVPMPFRTVRDWLKGL